MSKVYLLILSVLLFTSCTKELNENQVEKSSPGEIPYCGSEIASRSIPAEYLESLALQRTSGTNEKITVYLDFDGEVVIGGNTTTPGVTASMFIYGRIFFRAPTLSNEEKAEIIRLIEDDFAPFNVEFVTDRALYDAASPNSRMMCIITTSSTQLGLPSGISGLAPYTGSAITNQPVFVFCNTIQDYYPTNVISVIASVASHEIGHLFSLEHQHQYNSSCSKTWEYHPGFGQYGDPLAFAPIMGGSDKTITTWWHQPSCNNQNDFNIINNFVELKADDYPDSPSGLTEVAGNFTGTLGHAGDVDYIFIRPAAPVSIMVTADNIDLKVSYYTPGGYLMGSYNDPGNTNVTIPRIAGVGYLKIEAETNANLSSQFMTGKYNVTYLDK